MPYSVLSRFLAAVPGVFTCPDRLPQAEVTVKDDLVFFA
jgi:hypothetical protein